MGGVGQSKRRRLEVSRDVSDELAELGLGSMMIGRWPECRSLGLRRNFSVRRGVARFRKASGAPGTIKGIGGFIEFR